MATIKTLHIFRLCNDQNYIFYAIKKNIFSDSAKCQQFCYATPGCAAFTHFTQVLKSPDFASKKGLYVFFPFSRASLRTESVFCSVIAMADFPTARTASGFLKFLNINLKGLLFIYVVSSKEIFWHISNFLAHLSLVSRLGQLVTTWNENIKRYDMRWNMFSGPIMPRITECLAQRQEVAPEEVEEVWNENLEYGN